MTDPLKSILKNASYLVGARGMNMVLRGIYAITLARLLGPEQYGLYFYALSWYIVLLPLTSLGLWAVISRDVGRSESLGFQTVSQTLALRGILSFIMAVICGVSGWIIHDDEITRQLLIIFSIAMVGRSLATWVEHIFNAYSESKYVLRIETIFRPIEVFACITILAIGGGLVELAITHGFVWWLQGLYGMSLLRSRVYNFKPDWGANGLRRLLRKGFLLGLSSFLLAWFLQGPLLLAKHSNFSLVELGQLALLLQIFSILSQVPQMFRMAALPILSQPRNQVLNEDKQLLDLGLKISWLIGSIVSVVAWYTGPLLAELLFGNKFQTVGYYLGITLYLLIPWSWGNLLWMKLLSRGNLRQSTIALAIGGFILTITFLIGTNYFRLEGVLLALGFGLWSWVVIIYFMQRMPISLLIKNICISLVMLALMILIEATILAFTISMIFIFWSYLYVISSDLGRNKVWSVIQRK
jgi:O-antigen/teichoic acid export membrane protein